MTKIPQVDKEFAALIPPLAPEEFAQLEANIIADGCHDPLVTWRGRLLDGHNRLRICQERDIAFNTFEIDLANRDAAMVWIIHNQFGRRNLTPFTRAELALKLEPLMSKHAEIVKVEAARRRQDEIRSIQAKITSKPISEVDLLLAQSRIDELRGEPSKNEKRDAVRVYFVQSNKKIKVGASYDPDSRLKQIRTSNPDAVLLGSIPGGTATERELHTRFSASRIDDGEWFEATPSILDDIGSLLSGVADFCQSTSYHVRAEVAKQAGLSHDTIAKAKLITAHAPEEVKGKLRRGETSINAEAKIIKQQIKQEAKTQLAIALDAQPPSPPDGPFDIVVIDPPWKYDNRVEDITHRARNPYPDMDVEEIAALDIQSRLAPNAIVWLWTTNAFMRESYGIADAWGLEVKTILTWAKDRMGLGDWLRGKTEHCLLCVRGKPVVTCSNQTTLLVAPMREHSRKPDEFYQLVESLCHGRKLEWFAREARDGWTSFGAETNKFEAVA